jgi:hypothetical protein
MTTKEEHERVKGRQRLELETRKWGKLAGAIARILRLAE